MKRYTTYLTLAFAIAFAACNSEQQKSDDVADQENLKGSDTENPESLAAGEITFSEDTYEFGAIKEGEVVEHIYSFTNTGTEPVIISRVTASCGCTSPEFTSTPIAPGKKGEIKVHFDSKGQHGIQDKIVTVVSNSKNNLTTVRLKGEVI